MKKHSKLPNGFGCIKRLSGNRRKPYAAYPSSKSSGIAPALNSTQAIGYYEDWYAAYNALMDYNKNLRYSITPAATFSDVYHAFYKAKFMDSKKQLAVRSRQFYPFLKEHGILYNASGKKHTPHDCRHTFSWLSDKYHVDDLAKHLLIGHSLGSDAEKAVYGHRTLEELRREINKIDSDIFFTFATN